MKQTLFLSLFLSFFLLPAGNVKASTGMPAIPLRFEALPNGDLVSRGTGFQVLLPARNSEVRLLIPGSEVPPLVLSFEGNEGATGFAGEEPFSFKAHYFKGGKPSGWRPDVAAFGKARAKSLYPGIDLVFYGSGGELEFDFEISAGSDPSRIVLDWEGAASLVVAPSGDLVLKSSGRELGLRAPRAFQRIDGEAHPVSCRFALRDDRSVGFVVGDYDPGLPLVIDPVLSFSSYLGWAESDSLSGIVQDAGGNYYVAGWTDSVGLPTGSVLQEEKGGGRDVFVAKLTPTRTLSWITYIGGAKDDLASDIRLDSTGGVYVVGSTGSNDFPVTAGVKQGTYGGGVSDGFLLELNSTGSELTLSTYLGGSGEDIANTLSFTSGGDILVTGSTRSGNFPVTSGVFQSTFFGGTDAFVSRLAPDASSMVFSTYFGGRSNDNPVAILEQGDGLILSVGTTNSADLRLEKPIQDSLGGSNDLYVSLIRPDGKGMEFSTFLGGRSADTAYVAKIDDQGAIVIGGETSSDNFPLEDPIQPIYKGGTDMFIIRLKADLTGVSMSTYLGGSGYDSLRGLGLLSNGRVYLGGVSNSTDLPLTGATALNRGNAEVVAAALNLDRSWLAYCTYLGGSGNEIPGGVSLGLQERLLIAGATNSLDFPAVAALQAAFGGTGIVRSTTGGQQWAETGSGIPDPNIQTIKVVKGSSWVFAGTLSDGIYRSKDHGATWEAIGPEGQGVISIAVDPNDNNVIYAGTTSALVQTKDGGATWQTLSDGDRLPFTSFTALAFDPKNSNVVYAGTSQTGLFKTDNGGEKWVRQTSSLDAAGNAIFSIVVNPVDTATLYIGTAGSVYKYIPNPPAGEGPWKQMSVISSDGIKGLAIDAANPQRLYAAVYIPTGPQPGYYVARTEDAGTNWRTSANTLPAAITGLAVSPTDRTVIFASTNGEGIFKSSDSGESWTGLNQTLGIRKVLTFAVDPQSASRMYAGYQSSSDGFMAELQPVNQFYFPQIADGVQPQGRIKFQTAFAFVNTGDDTTIHMEFFDSDGNPLAIAVGSNPAAAVLEIPIQAGGAYYAQTPADPGLRVGYARVTAGPGVDGTAIFTRTDNFPKVPLYEAGVPATRAAGDFVFLLDSLGDRDTGIALVNTAEGLPDEEDPATIQLSLRDADGYLIEETTVELARGQHLAKFIGELFPSVAAQVAELRGLITVKSPVPVAALTLRQRDKPLVEYPNEVASLTPFPVMAPSNLGSTLYFPQVADGIFGSGLTQSDQFKTTFFVANPGSSGFSTSFALEFFNSEGQPMSLDLGSGQAVSKVTGSLAPGRFRVFETTGTGNPQIGYARLAASSPSIGGTAVFTQLTHNLTMFEAGVAATLPRRKFSIFLDSIGDHDTGLALVNTSGEAADITVRLYDMDTNLVYEKSLDPLEPGQHLPQFIFQLLPEVAAQASEMRGVVTVESSQPLAAVTLRQKNKVGVEFPTEVPTLTTFPVIAGFAPIE